jgi:heme oxygenase-like protein
VTLASPISETDESAAFRLRLEAVFRDELEVFARTTPGAGLMTDPGVELDERYYLRHRIETVRRIRETARTDALALARMIEEDYEAARAWGDYTIEEMNHDRLFLADLAAHGLPATIVLSTPPFPATERLIEHLEEAIQRVGSVAAVAYALFVEWNSEQASGAAVAKALEAYGPDRTAGSRRHVGIDEAEDHSDAMFEVARRLTEGGAGEDELIRLVRTVAEDLRAYFADLHAATVGPAATWQPS